jgi:hypothetical protein
LPFNDDVGETENEHESEERPSRGPPFLAVALPRS